MQSKKQMKAPLLDRASAKTDEERREGGTKKRKSGAACTKDNKPMLEHNTLLVFTKPSKWGRQRRA